MEARDLLSKLEKPSDDKSEVDCTLKLGLDSYKAQPSSITAQRPRQGNPSGPYYGSAGRGSLISYGGSPLAVPVPLPVPVPPSVICNNYGNLYYMNPQNNVGQGSEYVYRPNPRIEPSKKCIVCETSTTPLWRKGPDGEKSLCNACGIRYRKGEKAKTESP